MLIADLRGCPIPELTRLGRTLHAWRPEFLAHFDHPRGEARGFRNFANYRAGLFLAHGGCGVQLGH